MELARLPSVLLCAWSHVDIQLSYISYMKTNVHMYTL